MAWVENTLNLTNGYYKVASSEGDQFEYLVPFPPGYTSTMKANWTTDVIVLDPSCNWQNATTTGPVGSSWYVTLPTSNLGITLGNDYFGMFSFSPMFSSAYLISVSKDGNITQVSALVPYTYNTSAQQFGVPADGSALFVLNQLNYPGSNKAYSVSVDLSSIPTLKFPTGNGSEHVLAFLLCSPHVSNQTRQVSATGNGNLTLGKPQPRQGNIDFLQANYLLSHILHILPTNSGPTSHQTQVGTDLMVRFIFGTDAVGTMGYLPPAPLTNITAIYTQLIHSAMKIFLSGAIAKENVPGGYSEEQIVFTSSLGHIISSAILFAFLAISLAAAQFRKGRVPFTLVNVAAALADSDVSLKSVEMTQFKAGTGGRKVLKLVPGGDGRVYCVYESID